uniref:Uncharacterized protein n=1 Tax=Candidatus Kentrum sp. LFY TaxID=2126342 RepID=A0A450UJT2_9GAMM|nr:MAG: hypothetical protein BECKLFY1418A_GA0070994_102637 [Candidatus Kentron sp. LFY]
MALAALGLFRDWRRMAEDEPSARVGSWRLAHVIGKIKISEKPGLEIKATPPRAVQFFLCKPGILVYGIDPTWFSSKKMSHAALECGAPREN